MTIINKVPFAEVIIVLIIAMLYYQSSSIHLKLMIFIACMLIEFILLN